MPTVYSLPASPAAVALGDTIDAMGVCSLIAHKMEAPENVTLFAAHRPKPSMARSPELALLLAIYSTINMAQRSAVDGALKRLCRDGDSPAARDALDFVEWAAGPRLA